MPNVKEYRSRRFGPFSSAAKESDKVCPPGEKRRDHSTEQMRMFNCKKNNDII